MEFFERHKKLIIIVAVVGLIEVVILFFTLNPARSLKEGALHHHSRIIVGSNGGLDVIERIKVRTEGNRIKYGIARALPFKEQDPSGHEFEPQYEVLGAKRDGVPIEFKTEEKDWGHRIQLWRDDDKPLTPGDYEYEFHYKVFGLNRILSIGEEVRRNITGRWIYPILDVETVIILPKNVVPKATRIRPYVYHQPTEQAKKGKMLTEDMRIRREGSRKITVSLDRPLIPGEEVRFDLLYQKAGAG